MIKNNIKEIASKIEKLNTIASIVVCQNDISIIDIEVLKDEVRSIYSSLLSIDLSNNEVENINKSNVQPEIKPNVEESIVEEIQQIPEIIQQPVVPEQESVQEIVKETVVEKQEIVVEKQKTEEITKTQIVTSVSEVAESVKQPMLNDLIMVKNNIGDVASKLQSQPISNIKAGISLGDQFLYIREVFNNNNELYQSTIAELNNKLNFEEAILYLQNITNCDLENDATQKFIEIVRRKFL